MLLQVKALALLAQQDKADVTERAQTEEPAGEGVKAKVANEERKKKEGAKEGEARRVDR